MITVTNALMKARRAFAEGDIEARYGRSIPGPHVWHAMIVLSDNANNKTGLMYVGQDKLAAEIGISESHLREIMWVAEEQGWIKDLRKRHKKYRTKMYLINDPAPFEAMAESYKATPRTTMDDSFGTEDLEPDDGETFRVEDVAISDADGLEELEA